MIERVFKAENMIFFLLCIVSVFTYSQCMTDTHLMPKWYFTAFVLLLAVLALLVKSIFNRLSKIDFLIYSYFISFICLIQALYGILQWLKLIPSVGRFQVVGSFDNPAGFAACLCAGLPFIFLCLKEVRGKKQKTILYLLLLAVVLAIVVSGSRSGVLTIAIVLTIWLYPYIPFKLKSKILISVCLILVLLGGGYFLKKDSADGRLLIWRCSLEMVKDLPFCGYGINGFKAHYMDYQANFLMEKPNSGYMKLADNVSSPFNEYLNIMIKFGYLGMIILISGILLLIFCYCKDPKYEKRIALYSLLSIGIFSMFSYPFTYPFVWIIICLDIFVLMRGNIVLNIQKNYKNILYVFAIAACSWGGIKLYQRINAEYQWGKIAYSTANENLAIYYKLMSVMGNNPYFLYNYSVALFELNRLNESLKLALFCNRYWADYDLELLLGNIYSKMKDYDMAEIHYRKASLMCPCRFVPLYYLYELYKEAGNANGMLSVGRLIMDKPVKVNSMQVMQIRNKVRRELSYIDIN